MAQPADCNRPWWRQIWIWLRPPESASKMMAGKPSESSLDAFSGYVTAASALLEFLIKEGLQPIRDQIIDDIEAARELLNKPTPPSKEDRAKLVKAYRDLALVPRISVASARIPPVTFWSAESQWPRLLIWISIIPSIIAFIIRPRSSHFSAFPSSNGIGLLRIYLHPC